VANARFLPLGDTALTVELGSAIDRAINARILAFDEAVARAAIRGVVETIPTFRSLTVHYDPLTTDPATLETALAPLIPESGGARAPGRLWRLPACFEQAFAYDLADVAKTTGLAESAVLDRFLGLAYDVYMMGFMPGFAFMGDTDPLLALKRRREPRTKVPAGSVAMAIGLAGVYPYDSPGGWHLLGNTSVPLFDPRKAEPALLRPGDRVRFVPVGMGEHERIAAMVANAPLPDAMLLEGS
jgi:KipI family sensor histidine kinase inhibitor